MTTLLEASRLALEALELSHPRFGVGTAIHIKAVATLRQAIEQAQQAEPYCWTWDEFVSGGKWRAEYGWKKPERQVTNLQPLYTSPPPRQPEENK